MPDNLAILSKSFCSNPGSSSNLGNCAPHGSDDDDAAVVGVAAEEPAAVVGVAADEPAAVVGVAADEPAAVVGVAADESVAVVGVAADESVAVVGALVHKACIARNPYDTSYASSILLGRYVYTTSMTASSTHTPLYNPTRLMALVSAGWQSLPGS